MRLAALREHEVSRCAQSVVADDLEHHVEQDALAVCTCAMREREDLLAHITGECITDVALHERADLGVRQHALEKVLPLRRTSIRIVGRRRKHGDHVLVPVRP